MTVAQARAVVTRDAATFHEQVRAVGTLAAADDEATVADLLMCLRCREVAARLAACALYRRTGRTPVPDQPFDYSIDLDDWATYVAARPDALAGARADEPPAPDEHLASDVSTAPPVPSAPGPARAPSAVLAPSRGTDASAVPTSDAEPVASALPLRRRRATWLRPLAITLGIAAIALGCAALALQWPFAVTLALGGAGNALLATALLTGRRAADRAAPW